jgi:hypothetical protein
MASPITLGLFAGALYFVMRFQNYRWRLLASAYQSRVRREATTRKRFATLVAIGGIPFFSRYAGVTIEVCEDGLALSIVPPFSVGAPPLYLPFGEMKIRRTSWYLNSGSFSIKMARGRGVELIVDDALLGWIQANAGNCRLEP